MKTFKDSAGQEWTINITLGAARRVKEECGINLLALDEEVAEEGTSVLAILGTDELLLGGVIAEILRPQFAERGTTAEEVIENFTPEVVLASTNAFFEALIHFFRTTGREDKATAVEKQLKIIGAGVRVAATGINEINEDELIEGMVEAAKRSGQRSIRSPEPLD